MRDWLEEFRKRLETGVVDAGDLSLSEKADIGRLLELARVAAHESGDRTNAPLACYLVGLAVGRSRSTVAEAVGVGLDQGKRPRAE